MQALKHMGAYYFYPVTGGYGRSGVPDIVGCWEGRFFGIECKAGKNLPTALQLKNLKEITDSGGIALVINEENVSSTASLITGQIQTNPNERVPEQLEFDFGE
tara:strand:+ start:645 stop:953 length:309 start_codon:yes stop_codon:yes gene_type:complete